MRKNRSKKRSLEIDYEKLAEALVRAQTKAATPPAPPVGGQTTENAGEGKGEQEKPRWTDGVFRFLLLVIFAATGALGLLLSVFAAVAAVWYAAECMAWTGARTVAANIAYLVLGFMMIVLLLALSVAMIGAAREADRIQDRNYIVGAFSGMVSLAALVISLVALLR